MSELVATYHHPRPEITSPPIGGASSNRAPHIASVAKVATSSRRHRTQLVRSASLVLEREGAEASTSCATRARTACRSAASPPTRCGSSSCWPAPTCCVAAPGRPRRRPVEGRAQDLALPAPARRRPYRAPWPPRCAAAARALAMGRRALRRLPARRPSPRLNRLATPLCRRAVRVTRLSSRMDGRPAQRTSRHEPEDGCSGDQSPAARRDRATESPLSGFRGSREGSRLMTSATRTSLAQRA